MEPQRNASTRHAIQDLIKQPIRQPIRYPNGHLMHRVVYGRMRLLITGLLLLAGCTALFPWFPTGGGHGGEIDLGPFQELAAVAGCADIRNRLFLIDDRLVFHEQEGNCADASYGQTLYGSTPEQVLCQAYDSIAGPMKTCDDESYRDLFETMTSHLEEPDLGLGSAHTVEPVPF